MFDGLLGRGFAAKCKSLIKLTKNRIDVIRRKRKATEKFLKKDIADLLANGLDVNAYGRVEGLFAELTLSSCYDFVEQSCDFVLKHLSVLQKVSGCPEEVREAISSLMFAAARFSDLPELRDLRQIFQDRYESSLECYVNQEFATNLNSKSSTLEKKVHLMQDIASEFSIRWDSKAFELRMSKSSVSAQEATPKGVNYEDLYERSHDHPNGRHKFQNGKEAFVSKGDENNLRSKSKFPIPENGFRPPSSYDEVNAKRDGHGNPLPKMSDRGYWKEGSMLKPIGRSSKDTREGQLDGGSNLHDSWGNARRVKETQDTATARNSLGHAGSCSKNNVDEPYVNHGGLPDVDNPERKTPRDETPGVKPFFNNAIPPPYVKPNPKLKTSTHGTNSVSSNIDSDRLDDSEQNLQAIRHARLSKQGQEKELSIQEDATEVSVLKQKSMRREHSKSRSIHNETSNEDAELVRKPRSRRRDEQKRGLQVLFDDEQHKNDEEERIIDRLLIHYSKKPSMSLPEKARRKSRKGPDTPERVTHAPRSVSLPHEQTESGEVKKVYARAASFQPDRSNEAPHVHPNLPDCDDLAARIAALRGI
uniref:IST1-like protein n=1 Tax=Cajanus cajan TaxID=3821 RepID=A0A151S3K5_CAJCA|nr:IST1-like protein [Cajanus cajan]